VDPRSDRRRSSDLRRRHICIRGDGPLDRGRARDRLRRPPVREHGLRNAHDGHPLEGTWPSWFAPLRVPIDNCLVSHGLVIVSSHVGASTGSDHLPLVIELGVAKTGG